MDLEGIMLSEINQRKINTVWSHLFVESTKIKQIKQNNNTLMHTENKQVVAREEEGEGVKQGKGWLRDINL